jgi:hypothetical protein
MKKITLTIVFILTVFNFSFAGIDPTTAWWNAETFESYTALTSLKTGWTDNGGSPAVVAQTVGENTGNASNMVMGISFNGQAAFAESSQGGGRGVYKSFENALAGTVYIKTSFFGCTNGTTYALKNSSGAVVFEFGGANNVANAALWFTGKSGADVALGNRAKWSEIECVLDLINNKAVAVKLTHNGTVKSFTNTTLPAGTDIKRLDVSMSKGYEAGGFDNTTVAKLLADNIKDLSGISQLQTLAGESITSDFNLISFTNIMEMDVVIPSTNLDITWSISDYGTLGAGDQALVSLVRSSTDTKTATLTVGSISADATITLSATLGTTTLTKQVLLKSLSVTGLKSGLADEIVAANTLINAVTDSNPYINTAKTTLTNLVNAAQAVIDNASATIEDATTALANIQTGKSTFTTAMNPYNTFVASVGTVQSAYNAEIRTAPFFVAIKGTLNSALEAAALSRTNIANETDIATAKTAIEGALVQFNNDIPAYTNLEAQISTVANRLLVVNPRKGDTEFLMFPTATVNTLETAKTAADNVLSNGTTVTELNNAKNTLETALTTFNAAPRVAPDTAESYYEIYTYGSDNGDLGTKMILFADQTATLKYATIGNSLVTNSNSRWIITQPTTGKYTIKNVGTQTYLNGLTLSETEMEFTLPEGFSLSNLIQGPSDTYFQYYIVNPNNKGLEIDVFDAITNTGSLLNNSAAANRFRFCFQFEPVSITSANTINKISKLFVISQNDGIIIDGLSLNQQYSVYNTMGTVIKTGIATSTKIKLDISSAGVYFIKTENEVIKVLK